jgi:hypothetical protein
MLDGAYKFSTNHLENLDADYDECGDAVGDT